MVQIISSIAFKGGVSKTSSSMMIGYVLANRNFKTLLVDLDPQANLTGLALRTKLANGDEDTTIEASLMKAVEDEDLSEAEIEIIPNLSLIGSSMDFSLYPDYMENKFDTQKERAQYISKLLAPVANQYDYVIIDTPPSLSLYLSSALYASDWALCLMKTDPYSLEGLSNLLNYIQQTVIDDYGAPRLEALGILPVIMEKDNALDKGIYAMAQEKYGKEMIFTPVPYLARLKRFAATGVTDHGYFDRRPNKVYGQIVDEILERVNKKDD